MFAINAASFLTFLHFQPQIVALACCVVCCLMFGKPGRSKFSRKHQNKSIFHQGTTYKQHNHLQIFVKDFASFCLFLVFWHKTSAVACCVWCWMMLWKVRRGNTLSKHQKQLNFWPTNYDHAAQLLANICDVFGFFLPFFPKTDTKLQL